MKIKRLQISDNNFQQELQKLVAWESVGDATTEKSVREIIAAVRKDGDQALLRYGNEFDQRHDQVADDFVVSAERMEMALEALDDKTRHAMEEATKRIRAFHEKQLAHSWQYTDEQGVLLGQLVKPLERVGVYVPGGKAAYPSSVLMNVIPAQVAGVNDIIVTSPSPKNELNDAVLAAASSLGIKKVYSVGGAQAIAALAYGTQTVPRVDKIVGPGNRFVAAAKQKVFGQVGLDMVAGPSEILVVCDGKTNPEWIAMDLFSQAEHDEDAQAILVTQDADFIEAVELAMAKLLPTLERAEIVAESLARRAAIIQLDHLDQALDVINVIAPEHLELSIDNPESWLGDIRHAGAIFLGRHTPEAFGDYCAGPNHVLPTSATARFASPLGVYDFQKRSSIIGCDENAADKMARIASPLARAESLTAHARSAEMRKK